MFSLFAFDVLMRLFSFIEDAFVRCFRAAFIFELMIFSIAFLHAAFSRFAAAFALPLL